MGINREKARSYSMIGGTIVVMLLVNTMLLRQLDGSRGEDNSNYPPVPHSDGLVKALSSALQPDALMVLEFQAPENRRSGLYQLYSVASGTAMYRLAILRHDIECTTCRDLQVAILLETSTDTIVRILPLSPWELKDGTFDPKDFLSQFAGRNAGELQGTIDGISGATLTTRALIDEIVAFTESTQGEATVDEVSL